MRSVIKAASRHADDEDAPVQRFRASAGEPLGPAVDLQDCHMSIANQKRRKRRKVWLRLQKREQRHLWENRSQIGSDGTERKNFLFVHCQAIERLWKTCTTSVPTNGVFFRQAKAASAT